jgi:hypothetical protein
MMLAKHTKQETLDYILVLAKLTFFAFGNPELLEHLSKFLVFVVVFWGWTGFDSFTIGVVILRDERWVIASYSSCQCGEEIDSDVIGLPCRRRRSNTMTLV